MAITDSQIIDACVLINLLATGEIAGILKSASLTSLICAVVEKETIYLRTGDPQNPKELVQISPLIETGLLTICQPEGPDEETLYVDYASVLDDGEAMTLAIAVSRGLVLVTDERKARRLFVQDVGEPKRLIASSEILRKWTEVQNVPSEKIREVLLGIESRARYRPPQDDPNFDWWVKSSQ